MNRDYIQNRNLSVSYKGTKVLTSQEVVEAMNYANTAIIDSRKCICHETETELIYP